MVPQYQDSSLNEIVADLKDVFSRWPWYDEQETEYQIPLLVDHQHGETLYGEDTIIEHLERHYDS